MIRRIFCKMIYSYEAKDGGGRTVTGSLDAQDERSAARQVRDMGYFLMRLIPAGLPVPSPASGNGRATSAAPAAPYWSGEPSWEAAAPSLSWGRWLVVHLIYPVWSGVGLRDLALFYRQFAAMINAGVPIYQCLTTLMAQTANPALRRAILGVGRAVQAGGSLSVAMGETPWIFLDFHRATVAAGEMTGRLDLMFARLADALEQEYALRGSIKREMFYPCFILVASFLLPPLVLLVVNNNPRAYFHAAVLPLLVFLGSLVGIYVFTRLASQARVTCDAIMAMLPAIGGTVRLIALARFCRALALLYAAGVAIPSALRGAAGACGNAYLGRKMVRAVPGLEAGQGMAQSLGGTGVFPPVVMTMLGVGEQTGALDDTMNKVAEYYERESAVRLHRLSVTLGIFVFIIVAIRVAQLAIGMLGGYVGGLNDLMKDPN